MKAGKAAADVADALSFVNAGIVPDEDHVPAKVTEEMLEKATDLVVLDVFWVAAKVQSNAAALRGNRDSGDDGDAVSAVTMVYDRRLAPRRPGLAQRRDQEHTGFVDEDEVGTQPRSVFFIRGHSLRFHRLIAASSRSRARRSGFW